MNNLNEFKDIIGNLKKLDQIGPSDAFRVRFDALIEESVRDYKAPRFTFLPKAALASILIFFLAGAGVIVAAEKSGPGDTLYPVKNAVHKAKIVLSSNPADKAVLYLEEAEENIAEIEKSAQHEDKKKFDKNVEEYEENIEKARKEYQKPNVQDNVSSQVQDTLDKQAEKLESLESKVPTQAQSGLERALEANQSRADNQGDVKGTENSNGNSGGNQNNDNSSIDNIGGNNENRGNKK